jgi:hypothetical protein
MTASPPGSRSTQAGSAPVWTVRRLTVAAVIGLLAQVVVGVANTLWLDVPETGSAWATASPQSLVDIHMVIGIALLVLAVWITVRALRAGDRAWTTPSLIGLVGVAVSAVAGIWFMSAGDSDVASILMTVGCVAALGGYVLGLAQRTE